MYQCWGDVIKGVRSHPREVGRWVKDQATHYGQCFEFSSVLGCCRFSDRKHIWPVENLGPDLLKKNLRTDLG